MIRRTLLGSALALPFIGPALGQPWAPSRPVRLVVPFQGGGATDITARLLAERLGPLLGQTVVVDNRAGAGGNLGADIVAKSDPDGHTLLMCTIGTASINQFLYGRLPFRPEDLAAVALVNQVANGIYVHPSVPVRDFAGFVAHARATRGLTYGTPGNGTSPHIATEYLKTRAGIELEHVPYRGTGGVVPDLLAGNLKIAVDNLPAYLPHVREGRIHLLAVTSGQRWFAVPEIPTVAESGLPGFEAVAWFGVQAPARTPAHIIQRYGDAIVDIVKEPAATARIRQLGYEARPLGPADFAAFIREEQRKWEAAVRASGARLE